MKLNINGLNITFRYHKGESKIVTLLLHGWGGDLNSFRGLENYLVAQKFSVLTLDFPGFGGSDAPSENFTLDSYAVIVEELLNNLHIDKVNIICHSFGGRVALLLTNRNPKLISKLVLVDVAGLKPKFSFVKWIKIHHYKMLKFLSNKKVIKTDLSKFGSADYKALPPTLKNVFNNIVNTDLTYTLKSIKSPTLIIWGKSDKSTPPYMAKKLKKRILDSEII